MLVLLIMSTVVGMVVAGATGYGIVGALAGGALFVVGLPFAAITSFVYDAVDHAQDRADYRSLKSDLAADARHEEAEMRADEQIERIDRLIDIAKRETPTNVFMDNRQVHLHQTARKDSK
jgi:hypothetical protein